MNMLMIRFIMTPLLLVYRSFDRHSLGSPQIELSNISSIACSALLMLTINNILLLGKDNPFILFDRSLLKTMQMLSAASILRFKQAR
jgi:hypothetical protein